MGKHLPVTLLASASPNLATRWVPSSGSRGGVPWLCAAPWVPGFLEPKALACVVPGAPLSCFRSCLEGRGGRRERAQPADRPRVALRLDASWENFVPNLRDSFKTGGCPTEGLVEAEKTGRSWCLKEPLMEGREGELSRAMGQQMQRS